MSKLAKNTVLLGMFAVGATIVAATAAVKGEKGNCSTCPSQKLMAFFFGNGEGCGSAKGSDSKVAEQPTAIGPVVTLASDENPHKSGCSAPCNKIMADVAQVTYRVGDLDTPCMKTANATSHEKNQPVKFVVAGEVFDDCGPAAVKLAGLFENQIPTMGDIQMVNESAPSASGCPFSGNAATAGESKTLYTVAGVPFQTRDQAEAAQTRVRAVLATFTEPGQAASPGCAHAAQMNGKAGCSSAKTAGSESAAGGCCMKKATVAGSPAPAHGDGGCGAMKESVGTGSQVASGVKLGVCCDLNTISEGGCCPEVQKLVAVRTKVRSLVEAAQGTLPTTEKTASL